MINYQSMNTPYYATKLLEHFELKRRINSRYSLRAYARFLGVHASSLSHILSAKRKPTLTQTNRIVRKLELQNKEQFLFYGSLNYTIAGPNIHTLDEHKIISEEKHYKVIAHWEYFAVLSLLDTLAPNQNLTVDHISKKLSLTAKHAQTIIDDLAFLNLIEKDPATNRWIKGYKNIYSTDEIHSEALRNSYREGFKLAESKIDSVGIEMRDFSWVTLAVSPKKMGLAKELIKNFRNTFFEILESSEGEKEVYRINIQFFPLTNFNEPKIEKINNTKHNRQYTGEMS
ncbi:MAG: DUF4423 domain-containing protein [Bacteriovoracaceae bacterium]|nr:DUF4423 domain-containing protein [Bacteriovoracaceae bacterium]